MRMRVPDLLQVEPLECAAHEIAALVGEQQSRAAGIPDALLGPESPRSESCGAGCRRAAENEPSSFQAGQFLM
jgi:hypothetical protein